MWASTLAISNKPSEKCNVITPTFYEIVSGTGQLDLVSRWSSDSMANNCMSIFTLQIDQKQYLVCYSPDSAEADTFEIIPEKPFLQKTQSKLSFDLGWDVLEPFVLGNKQYVMCYKKQTGQFNFFEVNKDLSLSAPYRFVHSRDPGMSLGFTMVKPIVCLGAVYFMGYSFETGNAVVYSLNVISRSSIPDVPPLSARHVWQRSWSPGWTRFAFFTLGGENFFLKTNTMYPNVNIDHVCDNPADGSIAVATRMKLEDAQNLKTCQSFTLDGDPHFIAYSNDGTTTLYRINGDCQGFTRLGSMTTIREARSIVPIVAAESKGFLFY